MEEVYKMKRIRYREGQWFAIPIKDIGYCLGIIVRGSSKTHGGLGYFWSSITKNLPTEEDINKIKPSDAVLIARFGGLGISTGEWPLIQTSNKFVREDWPVPLFIRKLDFDEDKVLIIDYGQDFSGLDLPKSEILVKKSKNYEKYPEDSLYGYKVVEAKLFKLLTKEVDANPKKPRG
jgi:hypothetical protein